MSDSSVVIPKPKVRLKFIDMARSLAILLMLEGHFIEHTFRDFKDMVGLAKLNHTSGNIVFDWWYYMKGFTAPMFFTVTGLVFVYLLARNRDTPYFTNPRVKKGYRRALELLFWGYILQFNFRKMGNYFSGKFSDWVTAFHVLQSIGFGILFLLIIYGIYKLIKIGPLYIYYFIAGTLVFGFYPYFRSLGAEEYLPKWTPAIIQNIFHGPNSVFPLVPWSAFTLYGGMVGALLIRFQHQVKKDWFPSLFILMGITLNLFGRVICLSVDRTLNFLAIHDNLQFVENSWLYGRLGQIFIVLGLLMFIEKYIKRFNSELFLKIGQHTLPIYIIHVIILYGGIFGIGINKISHHALTGWQSIFGAALFITLFILFIKYFEWFESKWNTAMIALRIRRPL